MESSTGHQIKVGLFITIGLVFILTSIMLLGANNSLFKKVIYVKTHFTNVQGLNTGSVISYSGIVVGNIETITFMREANKIEVMMKLDSLLAKDIGEDAKVEIRTQGALGDKFIFIIPGPASSASVQDGAELAADESGDLLSIISKRGSEAEKLFDTIDNVNTLSAQLIADRKIEKITNNMVLASNNFAAATENAKRMTADVNVKPVIEKLDRILSRIDKGEGTLGGLINDASVLNQIKSFLGVSQKKSFFKGLMKTSVDAPKDDN